MVISAMRMADEANREESRTILDRAERMLTQSRTLRRLSDELLKESKDPIATLRAE